MPQKSHILITGTTGFLGRHLIPRLTEKYGITALVRKTSDVKGLPGNIKLVYGDLNDPSSLSAIHESFDTVIHLAALMSDKDFYGYSEFHKINVEGTLNLIKALSGKIKHFIYISTVGVLGRTALEGADENSPYGSKLSKYEKSKAEAEKSLLEYCHKGKINLTILRIGQLYGSGMKYGWPQVLKNIEEDKMFILGKGENLLHLTHVSDAAKGIVLSIDNQNAYNQIFNICAKSAYPVKDIFSKMASCLNKPGLKSLPFLPVYILAAILSIFPRKMKPKRLQYLDIHRLSFFNCHHVYKTDKAKELLGFSAECDLEQGVNELVSWYKKE